MRTNIDIDDALMTQALQAGPYKTKKDAVEAGLRLLARRAAYREILKWRGKLRWEGDESVDWTQPAAVASGSARVPARGVQESRAPARAVQEPSSPPYLNKKPARARR